MILTILIFVLILSVLVMVHEVGHFVMARKFGMKVEEFGFGFPPRLWSWKKDDTVYSINWIPIGGFVKIKGESGENADDQDSFAAKKIWQRLIVLVAGVTMNFILAAVLLTVGFALGLPSVIDETLPASARISSEEMRIMNVAQDSPASRAAIEIGDVLVSMNKLVFEQAKDVQTYIGEREYQGVMLLMKKENGDIFKKKLLSEDIASVNIHGVGVGVIQTGIVSYPIHLAFVNGVVATGQFTWEVLRAFGDLLVNLVREQKAGMELSGPVGIAVLTGKMAALGFAHLIQFAALLSINLAVINILPFPALDGGRVLFLFFEKVRGKAVDTKLEAIVHNLGFLFLMALIVLVTYGDFARYGQQILGKLKSLVGI